MKNERIKAFCIDFNWDLLGRFASPGLYAHASAKEHIKWYKELGVNTIQSFCVSVNGYAWYESDVAPPTPGMKGSFFKELVELGHREGMQVMGYFCVGANGYWQTAYPELCHQDVWNHWCIPLTKEYLDYFSRMLEDAISKIPMDGFMIDWLWNVDPIWIPCEIQMYKELMGQDFPGKEYISRDEVTEFNRRAVERAWNKIYNVTKSIRDDCLIWLSCNDLHNPQVRDTAIFEQVDLLMNEHPDPESLQLVQSLKGAHTKIIQCACGWEGLPIDHDAAQLLKHLKHTNEVGMYGFAKPDPFTTLPVVNEGSNARNIESIRNGFKFI